jgi:hypothetical protein
MDRLLRRAVSSGIRRGLAGEPEWLAVALAAWLVQRTVRDSRDFVWRSVLIGGEGLAVKVASRRAAKLSATNW